MEGAISIQILPSSGCQIPRVAGKDGIFICSWMDFSPSQLPKDTLSAPKDSGAAGAERDWGMGAGK